MVGTPCGIVGLIRQTLPLCSWAGGMCSGLPCTRKWWKTWYSWHTRELYQVSSPETRLHVHYTQKTDVGHSLKSRAIVTLWIIWSERYCQNVCVNISVTSANCSSLLVTGMGSYPRRQGLGPPPHFRLHSWSSSTDCLAGMHSLAGPTLPSQSCCMAQLRGHRFSSLYNPMSSLSTAALHYSKLQQKAAWKFQ